MVRMMIGAVLAACIAPAAVGGQVPFAEQGKRAHAALAEHASAHEPGATAAVVRDGAVIYRGAIGLASLEQRTPLTPESVLDIGSVSKQLTAFAIVLLEAQGRLSLDDDIRTHLPELPEFTQRVTVRNLLQHTSGLREIYNTMMIGGWQTGDAMTQEQALRLVVAQPELQFTPGSAHLYNNTGYMLLADIVARVTGQPFAGWMQENVFAPLGMSRTVIMHRLGQVIPGSADSYASIDDGFVRVYDNSTIQGAGGIYSTVEDIAQWIRHWSRPVIGTGALLERMQERAVLTDGDTLPYALGINVGSMRGLRRIQHGGSSAGFRTALLILPELGGGVVVQSNNAGLNTGRLASELVEIVFADRMQAAPDRTAQTSSEDSSDETRSTPAWQPTPADLARYAGVYYSAEVEAVYNLGVEGDTLVLKHRRIGEVKLAPRRRDVFGGRVVGELRFERADDGRITGFAVDNGRTRDVRFTAGGPGRGAAGAGAAAPRRDYSAPLDAPYTAENVIITTPAGHTLAGTLTLPRGASAAARVPAIVTISGSGAQERDEELGTLLPGYRPFRQFADSLGRRGIAVLRMDDRGTGGSTGNHGTATSADFAQDIRAGLAWLRSRPEIDAARLGLVGHSEGGLIAPIVATKEPDLAGIVLLAGPSWSGRRILEFQLGNLARADTSLTGARLDSALARIPARIDSMKSASPWMDFFMDYDVLAVARQVRAPVLVLNGGTDLQVTADQANELAETMRSGGNRDVTVHVFPDVNHLFIHDRVGMPTGYARLTRSAVEPEVVGMLVEWLVDRLR
jgi:hypothetical protein